MEEIIKKYNEVLNENELLKEELKALKEKICDTYYAMINLETINNKEFSDIEEI